MVQATLPRGKLAGIHVGRLIVRASGVFELISATGKVSPVRHKYCKAIHRKDGYMYALSTLVHAHWQLEAYRSHNTETIISQFTMDSL